MRDMVTCFSEHAVRISETTCSASFTNHHHHHHQFPSTPSPQRFSSSSSSTTTTAANQSAVTCLYRITLSDFTKQVLVTLTWSRNQTNQQQGLTVTLSSSDAPTTTSFRVLNTTAPTTATSRLFRKKKGTKSVEFEGCKIDILWDFTDANYDDDTWSPEPVDGFYFIVTVDSELGLMLGDLSGEIAARKMRTTGDLSVGRFTLVSRKEHYASNGGGESNTSGSAVVVYSTKARFVNGGKLHEIVIRCGGGSGNGNERDSGGRLGKMGTAAGGLWVCVDKSTVMRVKRLQWNFRGNQTVFVDGLLVDLFWDVHDWFFGNNNANGGGCAVFMFRKRCGVETRLWLQQEEEKMSGGDSDEKKRMRNSCGGKGGGSEREEKDEFSLLIYASK